MRGLLTCNLSPKMVFGQTSLLVQPLPNSLNCYLLFLVTNIKKQIALSTSQSAEHCSKPLVLTHNPHNSRRSYYCKGRWSSLPRPTQPELYSEDWNPDSVVQVCALNPPSVPSLSKPQSFWRQCSTLRLAEIRKMNCSETVQHLGETLVGGAGEADAQKGESWRGSHISMRFLRTERTRWLIACEGEGRLKNIWHFQSGIWGRWWHCSSKNTEKAGASLG